MAELTGVPEEALRAFSQRRGQVADYLEKRGTAGFRASRVAALATRERKEEVDLPRLREEWRARAAEHGLGRAELPRSSSGGRIRSRPAGSYSRSPAACSDARA